MQSLLGGELAPVNENFVNIMEGLHPPPASASPPLPPNAPHTIAVDPPDLAVMIRRRIATGAAGGLSGWNGDLLSPLTYDQECLEGLAALTCDIANGNVTANTRALLTACRLYGLPKANLSLRPVACGEVLLKVAAMVCSDAVADGIPTVLPCIQLAIGAAGGPEKAIHILQAAIETGDAGDIRLTIDAINAFNSLDRGHMLREIYSHPELAAGWRIFDLSYSHPSQLIVIDKGKVFATILSSNGVRQGCQLASLGYSVGVQRLYEQCLDGLPDVTATAIIDDLDLVGPPDQVLTALSRFIELGPALGIIAGPKTTVQIPGIQAEPPQALMDRATELGARVTTSASAAC